MSRQLDTFTNLQGSQTDAETIESLGSLTPLRIYKVLKLLLRDLSD